MVLSAMQQPAVQLEFIKIDVIIIVFYNKTLKLTCNTGAMTLALITDSVFPIK